jgi:hypothetical protein
MRELASMLRGLIEEVEEHRLAIRQDQQQPGRER